jgi:glycosidase
MYRNIFFKFIILMFLLSPQMNFSQTKPTQKGDEGNNKNNSSQSNKKSDFNKSSQNSRTERKSISEKDSINKTSSKVQMNTTKETKDSTAKANSTEKSKTSSKNSMNTKNDKLVVYQMMFHLWGNKNTTNKENGSLEENGVTKFKDINDLALQKLKQFGYSHLYMTGLIEHATMEDLTAIGIPKDHPDVVKGRCGSPFAIKDYYDVNPFFATDPKKRMQEFESMIGRVHRNGLKIILDCVPNHLARVYHSDMKPANIKDFGEDDDVTRPFAPYNNFYYLPKTQFQIPLGVNSPVKVDAPYVEKPAKVSGNDVFSPKPSIDDWFETAKLNYGVDIQHGRKSHFYPIPPTWIKMVGVLKYWASKGVDGFRCDMAEMVPVEFWKYATEEVRIDYPKTIFIAEIYNPKEYHNYIKVGGFDYLYDKVGLYDALRRLVEQKPEATVEDITKVWQNESGDISQNMLRFLENHDEVRINTPSFAKGDPFAAIPAMVVTATLHTGPLMIYFGQEVGESADDKEGFNQADDRTSMFDFWGVKSHQAWMNDGKFDGGKLTSNQKYLREFYGDLLKFVNGSDAVKNGEFYDLQYVQGEDYDKKKIYSYLRHTGKQKLLFVCNFNNAKQQEINLNIPEGAFNAMGLPTNGKLQLKGKFNQKNQITFEADQPIPLKISPNSVVIYEISEKK